MDLTIKFEKSNETLNVRVAIIMQTKNGFVLSHRKSGNYYFAIGGRAKLGESSIASAIREAEEETGLKLKKEDFKLISIVENFWESTHETVSNQKWKVHEINFVFTVPLQEKIYDSVDSAEIVEIPKEKLTDLDIRPDIIKKIILENKLDGFNHFVV
jgi:8-oxo-dGTP pyrophosphatase MutT (NUDIX family)